MGKVVVAGVGGSGVGSDECISTREDLLKGCTAITGDSDDEVAEGTLELTGNASDSQVLAGKTYYNTNPKKKKTGTMPNRGAVKPNLNAGGSYTIPAGYHNGGGKVTANSLASQTPGNATAPKILSGYTAWVNGQKETGTTTVQSILSFSTAVYSSTAITFNWKNPAKGPFSGVIIVGKTGGYPTGITDGTRYYKGSGNNSNANGISSVTVSSFYSGTTFYYRAFSYALLNGSEWIHETSYTALATTTKGISAFTSSANFIVPASVRSIDVFCVGGGGGGGRGSSGNDEYCGGGGAGGYTTTVKNISVTPGQAIAVTIGAGGAVSTDGSASYVTINGNQTCIAAGGGRGINGWNWSGYGGTGGSGGGRGAYFDKGGGVNADNGYSDGGGGIRGQGTTTRAFGESWNTLYAGGGGGGGNAQYLPSARGYGGAGGGGNGSDAMGRVGSAGTAGTGGGGGGGYGYGGSSGGGSGYNGGSGVCLIRWGY